MNDMLILLSSGVETTVFEYILLHVTTKFAHMNGHWKAYDRIIYYFKHAGNQYRMFRTALDFNLFVLNDMNHECEERSMF